ncbi:hypothetical protein BURKHO8Y_180095 [Burkholderia sp. 8Y]|nr:hypothetical protein BURKHO8Y_180095 [Burkholderia sp. 8Y]
MLHAEISKHREPGIVARIATEAWITTDRARQGESRHPRDTLPQAAYDGLSSATRCRNPP